MVHNNVIEDKDLLRIVYDAELKKLLAYIAAVISTVYFHFNLLIMILNKTLLYPFFSSLLSFSLWVAGCYFFIMAGTKYFELKQLENKLGITELFWKLSTSWNIFSKILHWVHSDVMGIRRENWKMFSLFLDLVTLLFILLTGYIFWNIQMILFIG